MSATVRIERFEDLLGHSDHAYLRVIDRSAFLYAHLAGSRSLAALFSTSSGVPWLLALGSECPLAIEALRQEIGGPSRWTVPRNAEELLGAERSQWDWWQIHSAPHWPQPRAEIERLGPDSNTEIADFLALASPTASTPPGDPEIETWHAIRIAGHLVAVGAGIRWSSGAPVLASIATHPDHRGRGYGRAITASLTEYFQESGESTVSLGMYAANNSARATYLAVGYRVVQEFTSAAMPQE